ncbi:hypothetical protein BGZ95_005478 [Linnemannia exigua]|uniref:Uncharacterized protein n=1 Tax=Linnemannia exigua TaxID=604196 RepID=A0AAD4D3Y3_9FUNG|nr:hypothetical protein BGZ95_005478 [Linnemannia exigua]
MNDNNQDPPELTLPAVTLPERQDIPPLPVPRQQPKARAFDEAVLYSCGNLHASAAEKRKTLRIIVSLGLEPISIKDALGIEQNVLAHATVISRLPASSVEVRPVAPQKRKLDRDEICPNCSPAPAPGLEHLLSSSPYAARLATRSYVELSDEICELLNRDWQFSPHLRYASAVILAGCLLVNNIHREPFVVQKGQPGTTSLPPSIKTPYKKVWHITVPTIEGKRLIIGTKSFDALITSSLRLDKEVETCIGASTPSFVLTDASHSLAAKIFLDTEHLEMGLKMAESKDTWSISSSDLLHQLRQVKTQFFDASTFYLCRASSFFADNHPFPRTFCTQSTIELGGETIHLIPIGQGDTEHITVLDIPSSKGTTFRLWNARSKKDTHFVPSNGTYWGSDVIMSGIHFLMDEVESQAH